MTIYGTITLYGALFQETLIIVDHTRNATLIRLQFGCRCYLHQILGLGLFPLHSQLLWESLLVSFPPLNDMLKFRG